MAAKPRGSEAVLSKVEEAHGFMSAIGSYAIVSRAQYPNCLDRAREVRSETTGKWLFKKDQVVGIEDFNQAWRAAVLREIDFGYSGYVLGSYLDAYENIHQRKLLDEQSEVAKTLAKVFTAAFPFETPVSLLDLPEKKLGDFCREEYRDDASGMTEAIKAAHSFYQDGFKQITPENLVVFVIR